jgi:hypothetical protein
MQTDAPFDYWISEELKQHATAQQPLDEQPPTLRNLNAADFTRFQVQLEALPPQVKPSGRFTFECRMGEGGVKLPRGEECVERSYWFEMPGSTWANPLYTIVHAHFSGLWRDYTENSSDESAGLITQINVRHSCAGPRLKFEDENFYGIAAEERGKCVFNHRWGSGPWNWRQDQASINQAISDDGLVQPGCFENPAWVLRLLQLFDGHPFYRTVGDGDDPPGAKRQRTEPSAAVHPAPGSASTSSAISAAPAVSVPVAHAVGVPKVLITAESQPATRDGQRNRAHLANVDAEATAIQAAFGGLANAEVRRNISVSELGRLLEGRTTWCFPGHGDAMLQSEPVLAFVGVGGSVEAVSIATLVETVRPHVLTGKLQLIVLTGCCTARLATKLRKQAFVPYVVCWETVLHDEAGRIFGTAFAQAVASNPEPKLHPNPDLYFNRIPKPEPNPEPNNNLDPTQP